MAKTNFEKLRVYKLSEDLSDRVWSIVLSWNVLARDTVVSNSYERPIASAPTLRKEVDAEPSLTTDGSFESLADHSTKPSIGSDALTNGDY
jgi:hypothetical protein